MSRPKSRKTTKITAAHLNTADLEVLKELTEQSGAIQSVLVRGLMRAGMEIWKKKKISTLEVVRLGAYSEV